MLLIRHTEEHLARCHQRGLVHGACHTYVGEEAIATGVCAHLSREDTVFSTHRGHGHALAKGVPASELMAELMGRSTGCSRGRGGSMHLFSPEVGLMGTSGIVASCILQAVGAGYTAALAGTDAVAVAFFGDGAVNNGAFHEGLNLAGVWKLPVVFVCENNQFATEVPFESVAGNTDVASRAPFYGMPGVCLDGNDVSAIYRAASEAIARARDGGGPTLLECRTYRTRAHAEGMGDFTYRTREEVDAWKQRCPILRFREVMQSTGLISADELDAINEAVLAEVRSAQSFAEASPWPDPATAADFIFSTPEPAPLPTPPAGAERTATFSQAVLEALTEAMAEDASIFVMGEGIGVRGGNFRTTFGLYEKYGPMRLRDTPISERGFVGLACGAAMTGSRPVVDFMFADFVLDGMGEILNQIAKMQYMSSGRLKMRALLRGCIGIGHSAATHHSGSYYSLFANIPGLRVVVPSNPSDAKGLLKHALRCTDPVLFLEHREVLTVKGPIPDGDYEIPFGVARVVRTGASVTVVGLARMVLLAQEAAEILAGEGIDVEIIDPRTVSPLDTDSVLRSVAKTGRLLIVEEAFGPCGIASEIAAAVADTGFNDLDAPIRRLNGLHTPTPYSPTLEQAVVPHLDAVVAAIRSLAAE